MITFHFMEESNNSKTPIHVAILEEFEMQYKIHRIVPVAENNRVLHYLFLQFIMYKTTNVTCFSH